MMKGFIKKKEEILFTRNIYLHDSENPEAKHGQLGNENNLLLIVEFPMFKIALEIKTQECQECVFRLRLCDCATLQNSEIYTLFISYTNVFWEVR
jgi:hypothetical protein